MSPHQADKMVQRGKKERRISVGDSRDTVRQWNPAVPICSEYLTRGGVQMWLAALPYDLPQSKASFSDTWLLKKKEKDISVAASDQ